MYSVKPWDLQLTRQLIKDLYGRDQLQLARDSLDSVVDRQRFARYHFQEATSLVDAHVLPRLATKSIIRVVLATEPEEEEKLDECLIKAAANITACVQCLHSIADILAHAVYYSLGCNLLPSALKERSISLHGVCRHLSPTPAYAAARSALMSISPSSEYEYLSALVNHSKHRSLVKAGLWGDARGAKPTPYTLEFRPFSYEGVTYERRDIRPFLEGEYNRLSRIVVNTGHALNDALCTKKARPGSPP